MGSPDVHGEQNLTLRRRQDYSRVVGCSLLQQPKKGSGYLWTSPPLPVAALC